MKTLSACCLLFVLLSSNCIAQGAEDELWKAVKGVEQSFNDCDVETMATLLRPDFNVLTPLGQVVSPTAEGICASGNSFDYNFEMLDVSAIDNTGIALYIGTGYEINAEGEKKAVKSKVTTVWIKEDGAWKLKHAHVAEIIDQ